MKIIVTGGSGFIGSRLIRKLILESDHSVLNIDNLSIGSNPKNLEGIRENPRYSFLKKDICDPTISEVVNEYKPSFIMNLAAESHVDRSINNPSAFLKTNIFGTYNLLECIRNARDKNNINVIFHHISTDEVYGDLNESDDPFTELTSYCPNSPYSVSKASSDHLVRAWGNTYDIEYKLTNCSNNYGPNQNIEKLIPKTIANALDKKDIPVYGEGLQIRDWLYVDDHAEALIAVLEKGKMNETYNIGGNCELKNIDVVKKICQIIEQMNSLPDGAVMERITFVKDRPGHDFRYAINSNKIKKDLNWSPSNSFEKGIEQTIQWYIHNRDFWEK